VIEGDNIQLAAEADGTGWVAFGPSKDGIMLDSDIAFGWVAGSYVTVFDFYNYGERQAGCPGVCQDGMGSMGGTDNILEFNGNENNGVTQLKWRRPLAQIDADVDLAIPKTGSVDVIWGYNPSVDGPAIAKHIPTSRGVATINFFTGAATVKNVQPSREAHGFLMFFAWAIFVPVGSFIARYLKKFKWWFNVHRIINGFAMLMATVAFIVALTMVTTHFDTSHKQLGLAITIIGTAQPLIGFLADRFFNPERKRAPIFPDMTHWVLGWTALTLGLINVVLGLQTYGATNTLIGVYGAYAIAIYLFLIVWFIYKLIVGKGDGH